MASRRLARMPTTEGLAELHTHLGGSVASDILWSLAHEQGIALPVKDYWEFDALVTVSDPRGVREPRRARPDLPLDGADPELADRRRTVGARCDRRRLPQPADHDARAPLQPDEAEPRRRARPRPRHPRCDPRPRPRLDRVPAGALRADPDDGPDVHAAAERGHRREGDPLGIARGRRRRHRRPAAGRRPLRLQAGAADGRGGARRRASAITIHVGEEGEHGAEEIARGRRAPAPAADRPRHPRRARSRADAAAARRRHRARDLPDLEPAHEGAAGRGRRARDDPRLRRRTASRSRSRPTGRR